jgi:hypothetical protein
MIARCNQSGWLIESQGQPHGNFEAIAACAPPDRGLLHIWHDLALPFTRLETWNEADRIRSSKFLGSLYGAACILSSYGNLEVIAARTDGSLAHFWRQGMFGWHGPIILPGEAAGPPALIQSRYGAFGNFEVVVPRPGGGLSHFWRDNDQKADWHVAAHQPARGGLWEGVGLIHSSNGFLEIVGVVDGNLAYAYQPGVGGAWAPHQVIAGGFKGRPSLIQNVVFPESSFLSIAPVEQGGLACFFRNANTGFAWQDAERFGNDRYGQVFQFDDVTMIQSSLGYTEVLARYISTRCADEPANMAIPIGPGLGVKHYRRACRQWEGPNDLPFLDRDP